MGDSSMPDFPSGGLDLVQHLNLDGIMLEHKVGCDPLSVCMCVDTLVAVIANQQGQVELPCWVARAGKSQHSWAV